MAEKIGYTIIISEVRRIDNANNRKDPIVNLEIKDIDVVKLLTFILENAEFTGIEKDKDH